MKERSNRICSYGSEWDGRWHQPLSPPKKFWRLNFGVLSVCICVGCAMWTDSNDCSYFISVSLYCFSFLFLFSFLWFYLFLCRVHSRTFTCNCVHCARLILKFPFGADMCTKNACDCVFILRVYFDTFFGVWVVCLSSLRSNDHKMLFNQSIQHRKHSAQKRTTTTAPPKPKCV